MKQVPIHRIRNCINTSKLVETRITEIFDLIATHIPNSNFAVDGLTISKQEYMGENLRITALRKTYALPVSYCFNDEYGPLGMISLREVLRKEVLGDSIFSFIVDSNGIVRCSDDTGFNLFDLGREIPVDQARSNLLYKLLGAIVASLPSPPSWNA